MVRYIVLFRCCHMETTQDGNMCLFCLFIPGLGRPYDEARLDYLLSCLDVNPEYIIQQEAKREEFRRSIAPYASRCLAEMRGYIPPNIFSLSMQQLVDDPALPFSPALAKRIINKKCLWLVRMKPEDIERVHEAELNGRFNPEAQNLDIVELAAIYAALPAVFAFDGMGKKNAWRRAIEETLKRMYEDMQAGRLKGENLRCALYAKQEQVFVGRESLFSLPVVAPSQQAQQADAEGRKSWQQLGRSKHLLNESAPAGRLNTYTYIWLRIMFY